MYVEVDTIEDRALTEVGRDIIDFIAKSRRNLMHPKKDLVKHKFRQRENHVFKSLQVLIIAGFVSEGDEGSTRRGLDLTEKGWGLVGGKPFWMGA